MTEKPGKYRAFGIDFQSELALPELRDGWEGTDHPVFIHRGPAPCPASIQLLETGVAAGPDDFWMEVPDVVRLWVNAGQQISVEMANGARESDVRSFLLGSALGALLHQRGLLPIHASAVEIGDIAVAFTGTSGAGKSTLALHLARQGHRFLCDDIVAIDMSGPVPTLWPGLLNAKLWRDTLESAQLSHQGLEQILPSLDKYRLPMANAAPYRPYRLASIFGLSIDSSATQAMVTPLVGAEAAGLLIANTFRGQLVGPMNRNREHFAACISLANQIAVKSLSRPWAIGAMDSCDAAIKRALSLM